MRSARIPSLLSCCALAVCTVNLLAADRSADSAPHLPTNEDLRHVKAMGGPQLSPEGRQVLFTVTDATADGGRTHVWMVSADGEAGSLRQLTISPPADKQGESSPQWSPDGKAVFFLAKRGEQKQLFRLDLRGGDARPIDLKVLPAVDDSKAKNAIPPPGAEKKPAAEKASADAEKDLGKLEPLPLDVSGFAVSPDGKWLAAWAKDPETPGEKKQKEAKADAKWVNHETHGVRLYLAQLKPDGELAGDLKPSALPPDVKTAEWSPTGDRLAVVAEKPNDAADLGPAGAAWVISADSAEPPVELKAIPATVSALHWAADGKTLVYFAQTPEDAPPGYGELYAIAAGAPAAKPVRLAAGFKGQVHGQQVFTVGDEVAALAGIGTRNGVVELPLDGSGRVREVNFEGAVITGLHTNQSRSGWVWLAESGGTETRLCFAARLGDLCRALPTPPLAPVGLGTAEPQVVRWRSEGREIEGLLYLPEQASVGKVPLVVDVHGGPFGAWENRHDAFAAFLGGYGWAVFRPNPRGSSNYGVAFAAANKNDLGGGDYRDIMAGVDAVLAKFPLDPARMALIGYSYGGEMAGFVEGKTDRFKAIVSGAPVIDQFSEYGTEAGSWYDRWYFGKPWEHMADAWKQSPLAGAARAKTPFLLLQGEADVTDPLGQSQEMYRALRQASVPVEMVTYPREDHGPLAMGIFGVPVTEPWHGFDARQRLVEFLERALGAERK